MIDFKKSYFYDLLLLLSISTDMKTILIKRKLMRQDVGKGHSFHDVRKTPPNLTYIVHNMSYGWVSDMPQQVPD